MACVRGVCTWIFSASLALKVRILLLRYDFVVFLPARLAIETLADFVDGTLRAYRVFHYRHTGPCCHLHCYRVHFSWRSFLHPIFAKNKKDLYIDNKELNLCSAY